VSIAASPTALPVASTVGSSGTRRRRPESISTPPMTPTSTPTVFTSQRSVLGPVTASNERMLRSGHTPVTT